MNDSNGDDEDDNGDAVLGPVFPETIILWMQCKCCETTYPLVETMKILNKAKRTYCGN